MRPPNGTIAADQTIPFSLHIRHKPGCNRQIGLPFSLLHSFVRSKCRINNELVVEEVDDSIEVCQTSREPVGSHSVLFVKKKIEFPTFYAKF